jgi:sugar lactone lactonase YvrE
VVGVRLGVTIAVVAGMLASAAPARAVPDCVDIRQAKPILEGQGRLESVLVDSKGRLFWTDATAGTLMVVDKPGAAPRTVAPLPSPGGLLEDRDGAIIAGTGNSAPAGAAGNLAPQAKLVRIDAGTGAVTPYAEGLAMANGLAWGPGGEIYASNSAGAGIDKVVGGKVQPRWAQVASSNGLAVDPTGRYLYAAQTFQTPAVQRVTLANPAEVVQYGAGAPEDSSAGLDGMTIDQVGRLFVTANGGGELWRFDLDGTPCALARDLLLPSAVALGGTSAYVVTFSGVVAEIENVRPRPRGPRSSTPQRVVAPQRVTATLTPRSVRAGKKIRLRVRLDPAVAGAKLRLAGRTLRTDARGRATLRLRVKRAGRYALTYGGRRIATLKVRARAS